MNFSQKQRVVSTLVCREAKFKKHFETFKEMLLIVAKEPSNRLPFNEDRDINGTLQITLAGRDFRIKMQSPRLVAGEVEDSFKIVAEHITSDLNGQLQGKLVIEVAVDTLGNLRMTPDGQFSEHVNQPAPAVQFLTTALFNTIEAAN
ncbi:hypothetical protein [Solimonas terrae]|uniref:Uncharacterized protein n=1 Tax=Solimonas terrae TaxID=1396819 RepID=A0A6M2BUG7_9GAMM|nr:hypothetical protein [Solimonas terrae]NGY05619.1 hypothetical protein [Solimonas terrae]